MLRNYRTGHVLNVDFISNPLMKTSYDPRHLKRIKCIQNLFAYSFYQQNQKKLTDKIPLGIINNITTIDSLIEKAAPQYPIKKIAKIDVAILRLAIFELLFEKNEPPKVIIDEAIELAHELGGDGSSPFINGVLGSLYKNNE